MLFIQKKKKEIIKYERKFKFKNKSNYAQSIK